MIRAKGHKLSDEKLQLILENEKERRKYMIDRLDNLEKDYNIFKVKAVGILAVMVTVAEILKMKFFK